MRCVAGFLPQDACVFGSTRMTLPANWRAVFLACLSDNNKDHFVNLPWKTTDYGREKNQRLRKNLKNPQNQRVDSNRLVCDVPFEMPNSGKMGATSRWKAILFHLNGKGSNGNLAINRNARTVAGPEHYYSSTTGSTSLSGFSIPEVLSPVKRHSPVPCRRSEKYGLNYGN